MSLKNLKDKSAAALERIPAEPKKPEASTRPVTAPGATAMMQPTIDALNERAKAAEHKLAELQDRLNDSPKELPLDILVEVAGRRRKLTPEQFDDLRANLAVSPLVQPIAVKKLTDGRYEVVSGHNRLAVYRLLGRSTIPVALVDFEDAETTERSAFFANLLQPALPDYERYLGFKRWQEATGDTQADMAERSGCSKATLSKLFSFGDLPVEARELIAERPDAIGIVCASDLARLAKDGKAERVIEAVRLVIAGDISQKEAVLFASRKAPQMRAREDAYSAKVKAGRLEYCRYVSKGGTLRIDFKDPQERLIAEEAIVKVLESLAEKAKLA